MNQEITARTSFLVVIVSILFALFMGTIPLVISKLYFPEDSTDPLSFLSIFIGQTFMVVPLFLYIRTKKYSIITSLRINPVPKKIVYSTLSLSLGFIVIMDEIDRITSILLPQSQDFLNDLSSLMEFNSLGSAIFLIITIVILAPLSEEILFRGFLQRVLEISWKDVTKSVLVTSMFFAFIHMNPYWVIQIYLIGILLGYLAWKTDSIIPSFILHSCNNGIALLLNNTTADIENYYLWNGHVSPFWLLISSGLFFVGFRELNKQEGHLL